MALDQMGDIAATYGSEGAYALRRLGMELALPEIQLFEDVGHDALDEEDHLGLTDDSGRSVSDFDAAELVVDIFAVFEGLCDAQKHFLDVLGVFEEKCRELGYGDGPGSWFFLPEVGEYVVELWVGRQGRKHIIIINGRS